MPHKLWVRVQRREVTGRHDLRNFVLALFANLLGRLSLLPILRAPIALLACARLSENAG
jgi:hypothetical protein